VEKLHGRHGTASLGFFAGRRGEEFLAATCSRGGCFGRLALAVGRCVSVESEGVRRRF
jgi:hypothetical protein